MIVIIVNIMKKVKKQKAVSKKLTYDINNVNIQVASEFKYGFVPSLEGLIPTRL